jgi:hypothetical protein
LASADAAGPFIAAFFDEAGFFAETFLAAGFSPSGSSGVNLVGMAHSLSA